MDTPLKISATQGWRTKTIIVRKRFHVACLLAVVWCIPTLMAFANFYLELGFDILSYLIFIIHGGLLVSLVYLFKCDQTIEKITVKERDYFDSKKLY